MKKRLPLFLAGAAVLIGVAFWDRSRATETTFRAAVTMIKERQTSEGPDEWFLTVALPEGEQTLGPLQARPEIGVGDEICVVESVASHRATMYFRAPNSTRC